MHIVHNALTLFCFCLASPARAAAVAVDSPMAGWGVKVQPPIHRLLRSPAHFNLSLAPQKRFFDGSGDHEFSPPTPPPVLKPSAKSATTGVGRSASSSNGSGNTQQQQQQHLRRTSPRMRALPVEQSEPAPLVTTQATSSTAPDAIFSQISVGGTPLTVASDVSADEW